jgi:hypothetical protein
MIISREQPGSEMTETKGIEDNKEPEIRNCGPCYWKISK